MNRLSTSTRLAVAAFCTVSFAATAQQEPNPHHRSPVAAPCAAQGWVGNVNLQLRDIEALEAQKKDAHRAGQGVGSPAAARFKRVPGPQHILEASTQLGLTADQESKISALYQPIRTRVEQLNKDIDDAERALAAMFRIPPDTRPAIAPQIEKLSSSIIQLREVYMASHPGLIDVLSAEQVEVFNRISGG